jgi:hypothetical protein
MISCEKDDSEDALTNGTWVLAEDQSSLVGVNLKFNSNGTYLAEYDQNRSVNWNWRRDSTSGENNNFQLELSKACRLSSARIARLHLAIREVLARAVQRGGSTLRDFSSASGDTGHFQLEAAVYGRAGEPCTVCAAPISLMRQGQRSTYFCRLCQRF